MEDRKYYLSKFYVWVQRTPLFSVKNHTLFSIFYRYMVRYFFYCVDKNLKKIKKSLLWEEAHPTSQLSPSSFA